MCPQRNTSAITLRPPCSLKGIWWNPMHSFLTYSEAGWVHFFFFFLRSGLSILTLWFYKNGLHSTSFFSFLINNSEPLFFFVGGRGEVLILVFFVFCYLFIYLGVNPCWCVKWGTWKLTNLIGVKFFFASIKDMALNFPSPYLQVFTNQVGLA